MDERAEETRAAPDGDHVQRLFAAGTAIAFPPQGRVGADPEPVGALIRPTDLRDLADRAGFPRIDTVSTERAFGRSDRLTP